ncbi:hypothetical protein DYB32_009761 [Aphanomyces invadans]|uniref:Uncharacterized protein n=1 Tax=Aphanomyces invadans TaxID=157072 RepID=A0A3R6YS40_9STRA|nr:hypothetical protein DYB32_009761 [Aphanomyces invadans]
MPHRAIPNAAGESGLIVFLQRKSNFQALLAVCVVGVVIVYFEMIKLSSVMPQMSDTSILENLRRNQATAKPVFDEGASPSIGVILTHYRDNEECMQTLQSLYDTAQYSASIHIYLFEEVELGSNDDTTCFQLLCQTSPSICEYHATRIHHKRRHAADHIGPGPARAIAESMVVQSRHKYFLSITTRLEFTPRWDVAVLAQWTSIGNPKALLSFAPPAVRSKEWPTDSSQQAILCTGRITSIQSNIAVVAFNLPVLIADPRASTPRLVSQYSEDFVFGPIKALIEAPSDPNVEFVWEGLAYYRAVRWWTRGYDFYSPTTDVVFEKYTRRSLHPLHPSLIHTIASDDTAMARLVARQKESYIRIRRVLRFNSGEPPSSKDEMYSIGSTRSLEQWVAFSGLNHNAKKDESTDRQFQNCRKLVRVA